ncbi:IS21-like element helper ATPase IstB [Oligosphaera ethanolica]|jgi:DNA replication protein DnaC|uniref:DNA replication protein DnaC n=1 Tax=Oligosphaera ethanolica TaxID=760260 RepID=A0AAE3VD11_9BACT|nr:IS21-like element helper ATPase IstB [Oligosphaera ethanolica]NLE55427.1 ATP-binding protein [Lentisphaerota bacterium]HQL08600.1 IS21-like element helper ATPase IstB [Lentisphaeria bacterium]MDQ0288254.1 DNA replication protein DnaC [Oligosphaera ethanolica]MDQ0288255.1 DNA replication protein DnaC [Oligosphaera ethanolica]MDQ0290528.1 DNA replication protein DnaC [Oligosphaera ethanolica]
MDKILDDNLAYLGLTQIQKQYDALEKAAATKRLAPAAFFAELVACEVATRRERAAQRRVRAAHFPVIKTLDTFKWSIPTLINRELIQYLFTLKFIDERRNVGLLGKSGVGKTHLLTALGYNACLKGYNVRFESAIAIINNLKNAQTNGSFLRILRNYTAPELLCIDEIGFLPIDQEGGNLLFQVISQRYETGSTAITSNLDYDQWTSVFNNDAAMVSALLDRLLHHCDSILIDGPSVRTGLDEKR